MFGIKSLFFRNLHTYHQNLCAISANVNKLLRWPKEVIIKWPFPLAYSAEFAPFFRESAIFKCTIYIKDWNNWPQIQGIGHTANFYPMKTMGTGNLPAIPSARFHRFSLQGPRNSQSLQFSWGKNLQCRVKVEIRKRNWPLQYRHFQPSKRYF